MKKIFCFILVSSVAIRVFSAMNSGFGIDAFNRSISAATRGNAVFSPVSFELDCVVFSETFGALTRSKFAEAMGVLNGLEGVYRPIHEELSAVSSPDFKFIAARAFCLPDERKSNRAYRQWLQNTFSGEAFSIDHKKGAECWFHARMDGDMEDFELPNKAAAPGYYSYYSLLSVACTWQHANVSNASSVVQFHPVDNPACQLPALTGCCNVDIWRRKYSTVYKIPLSTGMSLFAIVPNDDLNVRSIRGEFASNTIVDLLSGIKSITELDVRHEVCQLTMPEIDITTESDMKLAFGYFQFPMTDMERLEGGIQPRLIRHRVRFQLHPVPSPVVPDNGLTNVSKIVLDRPFVFFTYHEHTQTIPVAGLFMGL